MTLDNFETQYRATLDVILNELQSLALLSQQTDLRIQSIANSMHQLTQVVEVHLQKQTDPTQESEQAGSD